MKVENVMTQPVESVLPGTNLGEVIHVMWGKDCGIVPVVDEADRLIDVITDRDICIALGTRGLRADQLVVGELIRGNCYVTHPWEDLELALQQMGERQVRRLPVTDKDGKLVGMLSLGDIVRVANAAIAAEPGGVSYEQLVETMKKISDRPFRLAPAPHEKKTA
jgi:CBS domain-containing protein